MHPITVRTMKFDVPGADEFQPLYIAGNSALSHSHTATGLYVAYLEPLFAKSLCRVMNQIRNEAPKEEADRFCRQEAQHYRGHRGAFGAFHADRGKCPLILRRPGSHCPRRV